MKKIRDFRNFLHLAWKSIQLPDPTPIQYDIGNFVQNGGDKIMVQAFRGIGKTYICAAFVMHQLYLDPNKKIAIISASFDFAKEITSFCYDLMRSMEILEDLLPGPDQRQSKAKFDVKGCNPSKDPSVFCAGIGGQITGTRADIVIADDVEIPNNSMTQVMRERIAERTKEFSYIAKPGARIIYLGTPQTEDTIYKQLPARGFITKVWPAEVPTEDKAYIYKGLLSDYVSKYIEDNDPGTPMEPMRFDEITLADKLCEVARSGYALQYMLDTTLSDLERYPLRLSDLMVMDINPDLAPEKLIWSADPTLIVDQMDVPNVGMGRDYYHKPWQTVGDWIPYQGVIMSIDPSGRGQDETGYAVVAMLNGFLYVLEAGGLQGGYSDDNLRSLAYIAKKYSVNKVVIESNFGDGMFTQMMKPIFSKIHKTEIEEIRSSVQKELRIIDTLEPVMNSHKLVVSPNLIKHDYQSAQGYTSDLKKQRYQLFYQMTRITRDKDALVHDDRLDALAMAVAHWSERMAVDTDTQMSKRKDVLRDEFIKKFDIFDLEQRTTNKDKKTWNSIRDKEFM